MTGDATEELAAAALVDNAITAFGRIDILGNNVGGSRSEKTPTPRSLTAPKGHSV